MAGQHRKPASAITTIVEAAKPARKAAATKPARKAAATTPIVEAAKRSEKAAATTTVVEAARRLRIGRNHAYEAVHRGEIPAIKIGNRLLVLNTGLDRLLGIESGKTP
jgi:excisionase family DNA binding protein